MRRLQQVHIFSEQNGKSENKLYSCRYNTQIHNPTYARDVRRAFQELRIIRDIIAFDRKL